MECTMSCNCGRVRAAKRCPPGAHTDSGGIRWCSGCWHRMYILRAVTVPIAGPVDGTWPELREALRLCFRAATRLSNWAVTELAKADCVRTAEMEKLPKPPRVYLYPGARQLVPEMDTGSVVAVLHAVERRWRARRYDVVWLGKESLPNYRYDRCVYPIRSKDWKAMRGDDGQALVSIRLGGRRWILRLRGGHEFRRQLRSHAEMVEGRAVISELALYDQRVSGDAHRHCTKTRDDGGQRVRTRLMCKMVAWLPRGGGMPREGTLSVRTDNDSLLVALNAKEERLWVLHADHIRRWTSEHARRLRRWADDQKAEQRPTAAFQSRRARACEKYRNRLDSFCHEAAASLVAYARRRRFATIRYDDSDQRYLDRFCWEQLRRLVREKSDAAGMEFEWSGGEKSPGASRGNLSAGD